MRVGYQLSVDVVAHRANMAENRPPNPVLVLTEVLEGEAAGWSRTVHQVKWMGPAWTEYGWGPEREHNRGVRFGASVWVYTESPLHYLDANHEWQFAP